MRSGLTAVLAAALVAGAIAQARPDFSGRWTTDPDPALAAAGGGTGAGPARGTGAGATGQRGARGGARGDMGSGWGSTITITQNAAQLTVEYAFFSRGDMQPPLRFTYALDGSPTSNTVMMGRGMQTQTSRTAWDGATLAITTTHSFADPATGKPVPVEVKQALTLESPAALVVQTTRAGVMGGPDTKTRSVYRKIQ